MCIAIVKPADQTIDKETLRICAENNPDGCGFAYINEDNFGVRRIKVRKAMEFEEFYTKYQRALSENMGSPFLIHFRIKTHGDVDLANCHPFKIDKNHVFIHNGTISKVQKVDGMSDTRVFNRDILRILPKNWNKQSGIKTLIEEFIGYSKLAVMDIAGKINIYNEQKGEWKDGLWFSNTSYLERKKYTPPAPYQSNNTYPFRTGSSNAFTGSRSYGTFNLENVKSRIAVAVNKRKEYCERDYTPCDCCGIYQSIPNQTVYWQGYEAIAICPTCAKEQDVWYYFDPEDVISLEAYLDWLNGMDTDDGSVHHFSGDWENPWGPIQDEETMMSEVEYEEMFEATHEFAYGQA